MSLGSLELASYILPSNIKTTAIKLYLLANYFLLAIQDMILINKTTVGIGTQQVTTTVSCN